MSRFSDLLAERGVLLADGGTGTGLFARGLVTGDSPELWNVTERARVLDLHREFVRAGSDLILTNTFGANRFRLKLHGLQDRVAELNEAAASVAREAADEAGRPVLVAGSIGPTGEILQPVGALDPEDAEAGFLDQALALKAGGVDVLWIETMSAPGEVAAAVAAAAKADLPLVATMSFDTNGRTMMGLTPENAIRLFKEMPTPPVGMGANCGVGPAQLLATLLGFKDAAAPDDVIVAKGNCGIPQYVDGAIHYTGTPEIMADYARLARGAGARIIGGCCGTRGEHIAAMRAALDEADAAPAPDVATIEARLGPVQMPTSTAAGDHGRERRRRR
ncbi:MAG: betaine--homocysteine S-methyltransferase [Geminicoccaceae bacterium]|nr:betaine--homocysteine S-methyltransferase [Geminicoccaceae bacterium]